jgi:hypothetical protein
MEIVLPDGRKATVLGPVTTKSVKIRLEDGRETLWPSDKIKEVKEGEDTLKMIVVPAIERLKELNDDIALLNSSGVGFINQSLNDLKKKLAKEAIKDFEKKWGLI